MKTALAMALLFLYPWLSTAGVDNYLFENRSLCLQCIEELKASGRLKQGESYCCRGRYGDKSGNAYFVEKTQSSSSSRESGHSRALDHRDESFFLKQHSFLHQQKGLNLQEIKKVCPDVLKKLGE